MTRDLSIEGIVHSSNISYKTLTRLTRLLFVVPVRLQMR